MAAVIDARHHHAVLFDLDGVVTDTATVHFSAWKALFDDFLAERPDDDDEDQSAFTEEDYRRYVDGKPRLDGLRSFFDARGIAVPEGDDTDGEETDTIHGLGERKNRYFHERLEGGVEVFSTTVDLVERLQDAGVDTAVFSSSRNCRPVLEAAGLGELFPVRVDGVVADELDLPGKPDPAVPVEAAHRLGADPARTVIVEDAESGVEAGKRGGFGLVIGVDRTDNADGLREHGADVVVNDLADVELRGTDANG